MRWPQGLLLLFCLVLLPACATRLPPATPLTGGDEQPGRELLARFLAASCPGGLDADVTLAWQGYGNHRQVAAVLQAQTPGLVRLSVNDPLGRPLLLLVIDGRRFTLVDVSREQATIGSMDSSFWHQYMPAAVRGRDLFAWLTGRLPAGPMQVIEVLRSTENSDYWFVLDYGDGLRHRVRIDPQRLLLRDHLLLDARGRVVLDVIYTYGQDRDGACPLPLSLEATGRDLSGSFSLAVDRVYSRGNVADSVFRLHLPPHYSVDRKQ